MQAKLRILLDTVLAWACEETPTVPTFADTEMKTVLLGFLPFRATVQDYVKEKRPFPPLKIFRHGAKSLYFKTKVDVDGNAQARAILHCSPSPFAWKQRVI